ncbi:hypothetical protein NBM05_07675 [Rothia sp. AR01]|uniref:Uncharacterized protein n=1 Tax=Rothia santali TaxID=2949643 RepID=A0A9X2KHJ0_9MICC|nr:hypothetical protein [Rothia santali]MCP3425887.1 hypothetical protein [Rothia santali]
MRGKPEPMSLGQEAVVTDQNDDMIYRFKVNSIRLNDSCPNNPLDQYGSLDPVNGHLIRLTIEEQVGDLFQSQDELVAEMADLGQGVNHFNWRFVTEAGTTTNEISTPITYNCLGPGEELPGDLGPNEQAIGEVILDLPGQTGTLIYQDPLTRQSFEWQVK